MVCSQLTHRRVHRVRVGQPRDETERVRLGRVEESSGEEQLFGARRADQIDEPRAVGGGETIAQRARDRDAEPGRGRADAEIAGQRNQATAAGGHALHLGDGGHGHLLEPIDDLFHPALVGDAVVGRGE